ncbi:putative membrane protein YecN with MAPEG domain [Caulobacter ginsengisoli]|uniref:Membrane protein YecN with MAPEG domain n=1 Tax=Caulobacter ginsengisoli TaxID=400775 RepID=A0ABU0ITN8_9CAUL|nr:MAPEG family protein [Caulobacter ginsengisoli]MDQ0465371.1 putative membrane protein YecN with MAPEG domain [Caulobacter ginsengisoli]
MQGHTLVAIVTLLAVLTYFWTSFLVARARAKYGIAVPATTGHADFERVFRVQANTLEWMPIFLPGLWLFAFYWNDRVAAALGVVWILGRILYATGYSKAAQSRSMGFLVQSLAAAVLVLGALGRAIWVAIQTGGV